jgi:hypothetical protein
VSAAIKLFPELNTVPTKARGVCSVQRIAGSLEPELFLRHSAPEFKLFAQGPFKLFVQARTNVQKRRINSFGGFSLSW